MAWRISQPVGVLATSKVARCCSSIWSVKQCSAMTGRMMTLAGISLQHLLDALQGVGRTRALLSISQVFAADTGRMFTVGMLRNDR